MSVCVLVQVLCDSAKSELSRTHVEPTHKDSFPGGNRPAPYVRMRREGLTMAAFPSRRHYCLE